MQVVPVGFGDPPVAQGDPIGFWGPSWGTGCSHRVLGMLLGSRVTPSGFWDPPGARGVPVGFWGRSWGAGCPCQVLGTLLGHRVSPSGFGDAPGAQGVFHTGFQGSPHPDATGAWPSPGSRPACQGGLTRDPLSLSSPIAFPQLGAAPAAQMLPLVALLPRAQCLPPITRAVTPGVTLAWTSALPHAFYINRLYALWFQRWGLLAPQNQIFSLPLVACSCSIVNIVSV